MKNILITGSNGFVGIHLERYLLQKGFTVFGLSRKQIYNNPLLPGSNTGHRVFLDQIDENVDWFSFLAGKDCVIHLLGKAHNFHDNDFLAYHSINTLTTLAIARACQQRQIPLIFLSTAMVFGNQSEKLIEDSNDYHPYNSYSRSKIEAEQGIQQLAQQGLSYIILRPPMIYGPYSKGNFSRLYSLVVKGFPLPLGSIHNRRSFLFIDNLCHAIEHILKNRLFPNSGFLIADEAIVSTPQLIGQMAYALGKANPCFRLPLSLLKLLFASLGKKQEFTKLTSSFALSIDKICQHLHWQPSYSLQEGIEKTVFFYKNSTNS